MVSIKTTYIIVLLYQSEFTHRLPVCWWLCLVCNIDSQYNNNRRHAVFVRRHMWTYAVHCSLYARIEWNFNFSCVRSILLRTLFTARTDTWAFVRNQMNIFLFRVFYFLLALVYFERIYWLSIKFNCVLTYWLREFNALCCTQWFCCCFTENHFFYFDSVIVHVTF